MFIGQILLKKSPPVKLWSH